MKAQISKWGNSLAIRLPKAAIETLQVKEGEQVELTMTAIIWRFARPAPTTNSATCSTRLRRTISPRFSTMPRSAKNCCEQHGRG
ncbi:MAG: AbrB/MazE/SpoVT family DNA-binding domain-containing protein [Rhizobiales bacterium]|nr:AbrB/MazE/SpoVT family DNA-binding domain-containing protein [Hyphomicrobiales bacterium]